MDANSEKDMGFSVFRFFGKNENLCFQTSEPVDEIAVAIRLDQCYQAGKQDLAHRFLNLCNPTTEIASNMFGDYACKHGTGEICINEIYAIDLDQEIIFFHNTDGGWDAFPVTEVCGAALYAVSEENEDDTWDTFNECLLGCWIEPPLDAERYLIGGRELSDGELRLTGALNIENHFMYATIGWDFPIEEVFGMIREDESGAMQISMCYDMRRDEVLDSLLVEFCFKQNWISDRFAHRISEKEAARLREQLENLFQKEEKISLRGARDRYYQEISEAIKNDTFLRPSQFPPKFPRLQHDIVNNEFCTFQSFREYIASRHPLEKSLIQLPYETEKLLTIMVEVNGATLRQAHDIYRQTKSEDGTIRLSWPGPQEALRRLGYPELAKQYK